MPPSNPDETRSRKRFIRRPLLYSAQLALAGTILYWLLATNRFQLATYQGLISPEAGPLLVAVILAQLASLTIYIGRWWALARIVDVRVSLASTFRTGFQGLFLGLVVPGSIGIDGTRLLYLRQRHSGMMSAGLASIVMDRLIGYIGLLVVGVVASAIFVWRSESPVTETLLVVNIVLLAGTLTLMTGVMGILPIPGTTWLTRFGSIARTADAFRRYQHHKSALMMSMSLAVVTHLLTSLAWYLSLALLGDRPSIAGVVAITCILTVARTIPLTPLGLGVTDGLAEELYRLVSIFSGAESQMLIRIVGASIALVSGLAFLGLPDRAGVRGSER